MNTKIWISTGASRQEKSWKNQEVQWEKLIKKLQTPTRTKETYSEYLKMSKDKQSEIKDVGGFVGGIVRGGRRIKGSVTSRMLITLDLDIVHHGFWTDFCLEYDVEACLYSTHKHGPGEGQARYRLLIPMAREVLPDEYEAISRKVAGVLGIELFDPTTFQPERLMYWPSVAVDGVYQFERQESSRLLDPDMVLAQYADWRDVSEWPISEKVERKLKEGISRQEDPAMKGGLVGVFCRVHTVSEAIRQYLADVYDETEVGDRWTYKQGSTHGGLAVYDDKWAFSHHSTDPVSGRMCNAFDLVRIHLYGDSDDRVDENVPTVKKPSYDKMIELCTVDEEVKKHMVIERREKKIAMIDEIEAPAPGESEEAVNSESGEGAEADMEWSKRLDVDKKGNILNTIANCVIIMENDPALRGRLGYDDLRKIPVVLKDLPWRRVDRFSRNLVDTDDAEIRNYMELLYGVTSRDKIKDAVDIVIKKNTFHPVKSYLQGLRWDGVERLDSMLIRWLGADDNVYVREVTRKTLVAAVARVYQPGIKFDHVLVLTGPQGLGKSRLIARLGGEWYSDTFGSMQNKDAMEQIQGVWIMEIGELAGLKRQEVETIKLFISKQEDRFRVAYARRVETFARQCIFIGTTNNDEFLQDVTGNRRFWPVRVNWRQGDEKGHVGLDIKQEDIDQIWAEACVRYVDGEDLYLVGEIVGMAEKVQEEHSETHDLTSTLVDYLEKEVPLNWADMDVYDRRSFLQNQDQLAAAEKLCKRDYTNVPEIWTELIGGTLKDMTRNNTKYIRDMMNKMPGWKPVLINRKPYGTQRGWAREESSILIKYGFK